MMKACTEAELTTRLNGWCDMASRQRHRRAAEGKRYVARHRGRRGNFWGDPGKGAPGTSMSRAAMDRDERTIERETRREGQQQIEEALLELQGETDE